MDIAELGLSVDSGPVKKGTEELNRFAKAGRDAERNVTGSTRGIDGAMKSMARSVLPILASVTAALSIRQVAQYADTWSDLSSRVQLAIGPTASAADTMQRLSSIARMTYSSLEQTTESFVRNNMVLQALGKTTQQQLDFTESLNNALVVSGAKGQTFASVQNAIGKAMAEGSLRGEELNNVLNNGGRIATVLADALGISVLELRSVAQEGQITGDVIYNALIENQRLLAEEAASMPATIEDAFALIRNSLLQTIGVYDQANGVSEGLAESLVTLSDIIKDTDWQPYINAVALGTKLVGTYIVAVYGLAAAKAALSAAVATATAVMTAFRGGVALTAASIMTLQTALYVVAAAFAGWQIGSYMREEFEIVERAGIALMGGLHSIAIRIGGFFTELGASIEFALKNPFDAARNAAIDYLEWVRRLGGTALKALGLSDLADSIDTDLSRMRSNTGKEHKALMAQISADTKSEMALVSDVYADMFGQVGRSAHGAKGPLAEVLDLTNQLGDEIGKKTKKELDALAKAAEEAAKAARQLWETNQRTVDGLQFQAETLGWTTEAVQLYRLEIEGATAAQLADAEAALHRIGLYEQQQKAIEELQRKQDEAGAALGGVRGALGQKDSELGRLELEIEQRQAIYAAAYETEYINKQEHDMLMLELEMQASAERKRILEEEALTREQNALSTMDSITQITQAQVSQMQGLFNEASGIGKAFFVLSQGLAAANAIIGGFQAAMAIRVAYAQMAAMAGPGAPAVLAVGEGHAAIAQGMGFATAAMIGAQTVASFDGGGHTGYGPRAGGLDGKGGKLAMIHPQERIIDEYRGQSAGSSQQVVNNFNLSAPTDRRTQAQISQRASESQRRVNSRFGK